MLYLGKTTKTHGIKGELKFYSEASFKEKVLKKDFPVYIKEQKHLISSVRIHKNHYLITIDNLLDINAVEQFRNQNIYIKKEDLELSENEVLIEELVGFEVFESELSLGKVVDIMYNKTGLLLRVQGKKSFLLPYQEIFIQKIDKNQKIIHVQNAKGLIL